MSDDTPTDETIEEAAQHQPTIPELELPTYHGKTPVGMKSAVTGAGTRITRPHGIGDRAVLVVEVKCRKAGHEDTDDGIVYAEQLKVVDMFELDTDPGARLLRFLRSTYRVAKDAADGRAPIPDMGEAGYTDANGVVLTPIEVAERRGDPVRFLTDDDTTPVVVVYDDDTRLLWPDEFPAGAERPVIGDQGEDGEVVELLHHATGETIAAAGDDPDPEPFPDEVEDQGDEDTDENDGGYGAAGDDWDDVENYADVADGVTVDDALPGELELEQTLPNTAAFEFVDVPIGELKTRLNTVADIILLKRFLNAEKQGRGRGLEPRKGALDALHARIAEVEG